MPQLVRGGSKGSGRGKMVQVLDRSGEMSGLPGLARREIKNSCNLDPDREPAGMRQAVAYFSEYKPFLGSNLYDGSGFQGMRHQQLHSVLRSIKKLPLDLDQGRTKHPDRKRLIRWKADLGPAVFKVQALPPFDLRLVPLKSLGRCLRVVR